MSQSPVLAQRKPLSPCKETPRILWVLKCLLLAFVCGLLFSYTPVVIIQRSVGLPPAYALKATNPFADTSQLTVPPHEGERLHGAKLTPRITGSILLWMSHQSSLHPYLPASLFGLIFLASGIVVAFQITGDRVAGLFMGMLFAGLYASSACFSINWMPKPFDGVAIGLIGLSAASRKCPWLLFLSCFAACWTDERALESILFLGILFNAWPCSENELRFRPLLVMVGAVALYIVSRIILAMTLGWHSPDMNLMSPPLKLSMAFVPLAAWSAFEGGWIIIGISLLMMWQTKTCLRLGVYACIIALAIASSVAVLDTSRVGAFLFPLILVALAQLKSSSLSPHQIRQVLGISACISLLAPNHEILVGVAVKWLPSMFCYLFAT